MSTLKEKFLELAFAKISSEELRDECVKIADDYAIEFAEWKDDFLSNRKIQFENYTKSTKELLEIFKKERGL